MAQADLNQNNTGLSNFESKLNVPKIPSGVDKFKQTHNQHEDLRRRARYGVIFRVYTGGSFRRVYFVKIIFVLRKYNFKVKFYAKKL